MDIGDGGRKSKRGFVLGGFEIFALYTPDMFIVKGKGTKCFFTFYIDCTLTSDAVLRDIEPLLMVEQCVVHIMEVRGGEDPLCISM